MILSASGTERPRMRSITRRIFRGEELIYRLMARASSILLTLCGGRRFSPQTGMPPENTGRGEFSELVSHHSLMDIDGNKLVSVVHREREPDKIGGDRGGPAPGLDDLFLAGSRHRLYLGEKPRVYVRSFFERSSHAVIPILRLFAALNDILVRLQLVMPGLLPLRVPAPGRYGEEDQASQAAIEQVYR